MPLTANSTFDVAVAAYKANAPPFRTVPQCEAFINAASVLLVTMPTASNGRDGGVQFNVALVEKERDKAQTWLEAHGGTSGAVAPAANGSAGPRVTYVGFRNARG